MLEDFSSERISMRRVRFITTQSVKSVRINERWLGENKMRRDIEHIKTSIIENTILKELKINKMTAIIIIGAIITLIIFLLN